MDITTRVPIPYRLQASHQTRALLQADQPLRVLKGKLNKFAPRVYNAKYLLLKTLSIALKEPEEDLREGMSM
jgi:hypothetical protein